MREAVEWLGRWEPPLGRNECKNMVPALDARGYGRMPYPVIRMTQAERADFSRGPQMDWWMDKKRSRRIGTRSYGIKRWMRSITKRIIAEKGR